MSTEERDETQPRPKKVIPGIRRENTDQDNEGRPYQSYRSEGGNYERRSYNRPNQGYGRPYGDRQKRPSYNNNYEGGYGNREGGFNRDGGYGNREGGYGRPSYNNNRGYNSNRDGGYGYNNNRDGGYNRPSYRSTPYNNNGDQQRPSYNRPSRPNYDERPGRAYSATPSGEVMDGTGEVKKRRPRVGDARVNTGYDYRGGGNRPSYNSNNRGGYNNGNNQQRRPGGMNIGRGGNNNQRRQGGAYNPNAKYSVQKQLKYKEVLADPNEPIRLNKFLSNAGVCSRREADEFIQNGEVTVNGEVITELGTKITRQDVVMFRDKQVQIESKVYIVLNKPKNCVTTSDDPQERLTVMDLVKNACTERIYPVGRLDRNTTGVLLLTNDGDLASKLTHPSFKKKKIYHVWLDKDVAVEDMEKIANGLELEDGEIHADAISYASETDKKQVGIEIHSGRNRIVRRIFESLGYHVTKLDRVYFAGLTKKNLGRGKWRYLNEKEVNALRMGAFE